MLAIALLALARVDEASIYLDETEGLDAEARIALVEDLRRAIEKCGTTARLDTFATSLEDAQSRGRVVLEVAMVAGAKLARLTLVRHDAGEVTRRVQVDLPTERATWGPAFEGAAAILFPRPLPSVALEPAVPVPPPDSTNRVVAYSVAGGGVGLAGVAVVLRVLADKKGNKAEALAAEGQRIPAEEAVDESRTLGLTSNLGLGLAAALITGAVVYLLAGAD